MADAHYFETTVQNVRDRETAVAIATDWLRDELDSVDLADVDTFEESSGIRVMFCARLSETQVETIMDSTGFEYLSTA